jgi:hypothetical protein
MRQTRSAGWTMALRRLPEVSRKVLIKRAFCSGLGKSGTNKPHRHISVDVCSRRADSSCVSQLGFCEPQSGCADPQRRTRRGDRRECAAPTPAGPTYGPG